MLHRVQCMSTIRKTLGQALEAHSFGCLAGVELEDGVGRQQSEVLAAGAPKVVLLPAAPRKSLGLLDSTAVAPEGMQAPVVGIQREVLALGFPAWLAPLLLLLPGPEEGFCVKASTWALHTSLMQAKLLEANR